MTRFRCLAEGCEDNCCHGWRVTVDRKHHDLLRARLGAAEADAAMHLVDGDDPRRRALVVLDEEGRCFFEDARRLCTIQSRFGAELLPDGCHTFPRVIGRLDDRHELAGSLSCPEVARLVLLAPDGLELVEAPRALFGRGLVTQRARPEVDGYEAAFGPVRELFLRLLALDRYPLASRLWFVALFADYTRDRLRRGGEAIPPGELAALAATAAAGPELDGMQRVLEQSPVTGEVGLQVVREILRRPELAGLPVGPPRPPPPGLDAILARYAADLVLRDWFVRGNVLVAWVWGWLARIATVKHLLLASDEPLETRAVRVVYTLSRMFEHDRPLADSFIATLEAQGLLSIEHAVSLIRAC
jgi:hypothetical protein